jgi:hypothetical protein
MADVNSSVKLKDSDWSARFQGRSYVLLVDGFMLMTKSADALMAIGHGLSALL